MGSPVTFLLHSAALGLNLIIKRALKLGSIEQRDFEYISIFVSDVTKAKYIQKPQSLKKHSSHLV